MTDKKVQIALNKLASIASELDTEAKTRYGKGGFLFYESEGAFHLMAGDADNADNHAGDRQQYIRFSSSRHCNMGAGAW